MTMKTRTQSGAVLVFREGVTREEAEKAIATLKALLDPTYWTRELPKVHEFNPDHGGPVWYIP